MQIKCTGTVSTNNTRLVTGVNTKFLLELRPGDEIKIGNSYTEIICIYNDKQLEVNDNIPYYGGIQFYITSVNPQFILTMGKVQYLPTDIQMGLGVNNNYTQTLLAGGQAFGNVSVKSLSTLHQGKSIALPNGFNYFTPFLNLSLVSTKADSTIVTVYEPDIRISSTQGSNVIKYIAGTTSHILPGLCIYIDNTPYTITKLIRTSNSSSNIWLDTSIYVDKPVHKTFGSVYLQLNPNFEQLFPVGSIVLLNGKIYPVIKSFGKSLQFKYPISDTAVVSIRRPLMGTQYATNTIELFNIPYDYTYLVPGNRIILQDIRSEDNLYAVNTCYTEMKHIARVFDDNRLITTELNGTAFTGIVCFGVPNYGLCSSTDYTYATGNSVTNQNGSLPTMFVGNRFVMNDTICTVTSINYNSYSIDKTLPTGFYPLYLPNYNSGWSSYSPLIKGLAIKLVEKIIETGIRRVASVNSLIKEFLYSNEFACELVSHPIKIASVYEPDYFAVNLFAAPPSPYTLEVAVNKVTPLGKYSLDKIVFKRCGLPLSSAKG